MKKRKRRRRTVKVELRLIPWSAFALKSYAKWHGRSISFTVMEAINCLLSYVPQSVIDGWLDEYHGKPKKVENYEETADVASPEC